MTSTITRKERFTKASAADVSNYSTDSYISRLDLVRLIAEKIRGDRPAARVRNSISKRIAYAIRTERLSPAKQGRFVFGTVIFWAQQTWPGKLNDFPSTPTPIYGAVDATSPRLCSSIDGCSYPNDIENCHQLIAELYERIRNLESNLVTAQENAAELKPDAEKYRRIVEKNRESGRKTGRGNTS